MQVFHKPTVVAQNLSKSYYLTRDGSSRSLRRKNMIEVEALKKMDIAAFSGESIGVLGKNGSGKSTFLRLIAGAESPSTGTILTSSSPTLLGVSAALDRNQSGRQNIWLGLLAMGLEPTRIEQIEDDVADWADLREAIDRPLKTYSSGMNARLKFSIATSVPAEILLVDEALSTGDSTFAAKAKERMNQFLETSGTVFLVSHGAKTIEEHCSRAIWLHQGEFLADGDTAAITKMYRSWSRFKASGKDDKADEVIEYAKKNAAPKKVMLDSQLARLADNSTAFSRKD